MYGENKTGKGFVFSTDAALGIIVVLIAAASMTMLYAPDSSWQKIFQSTSRSMADSAVVGFYMNKVPADMGLETEIPAAVKQGYCGRIYDYNADNGAPGIQSAPMDRNYCGGI
ncbi:MAG: hypothetical protein PHH08_04880 [Candidatus ainarchaeum sp.]|nr:hypothetical protein [Candidatus ainarchaeum sp.]